jgi:hypothetical protein
MSISISHVALLSSLRAKEMQGGKGDGMFRSTSLFINACECAFIYTSMGSCFNESVHSSDIIMSMRQNGLQIHGTKTCLTPASGPDGSPRVFA